MQRTERWYHMLWLIPVLLVIVPALAFSQINLTFSVDMGREITGNRFDVDEDIVVVRGSFNNWSGTAHQLLPPAEGTVYSGTFEVSSDLEGETIEFKFVIVPGEGDDVWEGNIGNRKYTVTEESDQEVPQAIFNVAYIQNVTFWADLIDRFEADQFDPETDIVVMRGTFQPLIDPDEGQWSGTTFQMEHVEDDERSDHAYKLTLGFPGETVDIEIQWKFVIVTPDEDRWQADPNRKYTLTGHEHQELPFVKFDAMYGEPTTAKVLFLVDLRAQMLAGNFIPDRDDRVFVKGPFNGWSPADEMFADFEVEGWYEIELEFEWVPGTDVDYKYFMQAGDGSAMPNGGWEFGPNRSFMWTGEDLVLERRFWSDIDIEGFLAQDVDVTFRVDVSGAVDEDEDPITGDVYISGANPPLFWIWDHTDLDRSHLKLTETDVAGVYQVTITFPTGTIRELEYKYGIEVAENQFAQESGFMENRITEIPLEVYAILVEEAPWGDWDVPGTITSVERFGEDIPLVYTLEQNYPNPFNPATTIVYHLPQTEKVTLRVYNILGQEVATLVNEVQSPGSYQAVFDASHLASGVYIYRLQAGSFTDVKRMVLIK